MPSTPRGQHTEAAIIAAARKVFAEKGFFNAKISDISSAAGRSTGSFYNYYTSKEDLLATLSVQFSEEVLDVFARTHHSEDPYETIRDATRAFWIVFKDYLPEMIGIFQLSMTDEVFAQRWTAIRAYGLRSILVELKRAKRSGHLEGMDLDATASALVSMFHGYCWTWLASYGDDVKRRPTDETSIDTLAQIWYRTMYGPDPRSAHSAS